MMWKPKRKAVETAVLLGLVFAILLSVSRFSAVCDDLRGNVLRLHILANSDSPEDQAVKLKVRDRLIAETSFLFDGQTELSRAEEIATENLPRFCEIAAEVLRENGFSYDVTAAVEDSFFETREYEDFTLPAGTYRSLMIRLGAGKGKNWWCVVFPAVCVPAAEGKLADSVSSVSADVAEHPSRYVMRFKAVEWYETLRKKLSF